MKMDTFAGFGLSYGAANVMIISAFIACVLIAVAYYYRSKAKGATFPLKPNRQRRDLQTFIERHELKHPEASVNNIRHYLEHVRTSNPQLTVTPSSAHVTAYVLNHKPVGVRVESGLYRARFGSEADIVDELYASPLALVWHICRWNLTYQDEQLFYRHVKKQRLYEVRDKMVYFHISVKDHSSFKKIDGVWHYAPPEKRSKRASSKPTPSAFTSSVRSA
jgi:hypothetical protein